MPFEPSDLRGLVVAHVPHPHKHASEHERRTLLQFARRFAALRGWGDGGFFDPAVNYREPLYFVPADTLTSAEASALGIRGADDLFGGVVPHAFVGSKLISHPLVAPDAQAIEGWNEDFASQVGDAVLTGFSVFTTADAHRAGDQLLERGRVRVKPVDATGGHGQVVVHDRAALRKLVDGLDPTQLRAQGLVLEEDLDQSTTISVGQVRVADLTASYFGVQRLTPNNKGEQVFGGSDLSVARGGYDALLSRPLPPEVVRAIEQARRYDAAVQACYPGFYASRSNYDVLLGRDGAGRWRSAVLEQSWRPGGATSAELAALEVFRADPARDWVRCRSVEVFGDSPEPPPQATVYFRGVDPSAGPLTKYALVQDDVDAR